jgi:STIP1 family protein 1
MVTAYAYAMEQRVKYVGDILQALLVARKRKWDENEVVRMERESEVFKYVKALVEKERKELLEDAGQDEEKIDDINYIQVRDSRVCFNTVITIPVAKNDGQDERICKIQKVFGQSKENVMVSKH